MGAHEHSQRQERRKRGPGGTGGRRGESTIEYRVPTILRIRGYRFFFFSNERAEPPHIHVELAERYAKFWVESVSLAANAGFRSGELTELRALVVEHRAFFLEKWNEYFGNQG